MDLLNTESEMGTMRVKLIPSAAPFLGVLAREIVAAHHADLPDLSRLLVVFPNRRSQVYFRRSLLEASGRPGLLPPELLTVEEFTATMAGELGLPPARLLTRLERNFLLKQAVDEVKVKFWDQLPFLKFIGIGDRLLNLFDELAQANLTLERVEAVARAGHYPEKYIEEELTIIRAVFGAYRRRLARDHHHDKLDQLAVLREQFSVRLLARWSRIVFAGLVAPTPLETELLTAILAGFPSELVLHADRDELAAADHPGHRAYLHRKLLAALGLDPAAVPTVAAKTPPAPTIRIREHETECQQLLWVRESLAGALSRHEAHRIAVVLPDPSLLPGVTETLRALGVPHNVSLGLPLTQSPLFSLLAALRKVAAGGGHYPDLIAAARHPLIKNAAVGETLLRGQVYRLEEYLVAERRNCLDLAAPPAGEFRELFELLREGVAAVTAAQPWPAWLAGVREFLTALLRRNRERFRAGLAGVEPLLRQLDELGQLRAQPPSGAGGLPALDLLLKVLEDGTFTLPGEPLQGVQVLGVLEARTLDFDCVIVPSLNEGTFPKRSAKDLFLNPQLRETLGLTTARERESHFYHYFAELTTGKREVALGCRVGKDRLRSRFLELLAARGAAIESRPARLARSAPVGPRTAARTPESHRLLLDRLADAGISPTDLKNYRQCPYRFYLHYLGGWREPAALVEEPTNREWGSAIHNALRDFYRTDYPAGFTAAQLDQAQAQLGERLKSALALILAVRPSPLADLDLDLYRRRLARFAELELERFAAGITLAPERLEEKLNHRIELDGAAIRLKGKVDRIDRHGEQLVVIDYKLSAPKRADYTPGPGLTEYQLPLYALLAAPDRPERIEALAYCHLGREVKWVTVAAGDEVADYLDSFRNETLLPALRELLDPAVAFTAAPSADHCRYCPFTALCGVNFE